jgi:anthranilate/para-aminobenzoate synthase component I
MEISTQRVERPSVGPLEAFAKLRAHTPGRGAFLLESCVPDDAARRFSIVGYRVRSGESMMPNVDAIAVAAALEREALPESFAAALAQATVGFFSPAIARVQRRLPLTDDEIAAGFFNAGATVMLFDHRDGSATVAGPAKGNLVPRLLYELEHPPGSAAPPAAAPGALFDPHALVEDTKLLSRARRVQDFLAEDEALSSVVLTQHFVAPFGSGDPFDAYRALRRNESAMFGYYIDFGESPVAPTMQVFGLADELLYRRSRDEPADLHRDLSRALAHPTTVGVEVDAALRVLKRLEDSSRELYGGAIGYLCPGGEAAFALADRVVMVLDRQASVVVGEPVTVASDPAGLPERLRERASPLLSAVRSAQNADA